MWCVCANGHTRLSVKWTEHQSNAVQVAEAKRAQNKSNICINKHGCREWNGKKRTLNVIILWKQEKGERRGYGWERKDVINHTTILLYYHNVYIVNEEKRRTTHSSAELCDILYGFALKEYKRVADAIYRCLALARVRCLLPSPIIENEEKTP